MLIIPEAQAIFICPPRTGSSTLRDAVRERFPSSFLLYRHAERDAIPAGFESYKVLGFVRHPVIRMWSLYKFLCQLDPATTANWVREEVLEQVENVQKFKGFEDWLCNNERLFLPRDSAHPGLFQRHYVPENCKSQHDYLRPDLGTEVLPFADLRGWLEHWGMADIHRNASHGALKPTIGREAMEHIMLYAAWELGLDLETV